MPIRTRRQPLGLALALVLLPTLPAAGAGKGVPPGDRLAVVPLAIHAVQGDGDVSPVATSEVEVEGVVTALTRDGYFLQSLQPDSDPATSEGLFVHTGTPPGPDVARGNHLRVVGRVEEFLPADAPSQLPVTRLLPTAQEVLASGLALPAGVDIPAAELGPGAGFDALERYEGMRVRLPGLRVAGATGGRFDPVSGEAVNDGVLHAVHDGRTLPYRQPGLPLLGAAEPPAGKAIGRDDGYPGVLRIDTAGQPGAPSWSLGAGASLDGVAGVMHYEEGRYTVLPDPDASTSSDFQSLAAGAGTLPSPQLRIAWYLSDRLVDATDDPGRDEPIATALAYAERLARTASDLCIYAPGADVVAVAGVEHAGILADLATAIGNGGWACASQPAYQVVHAPGGAGDGDLGFLVSPRLASAGRMGLAVLANESLAGDAVFDSPDGSSEPLFATAPRRLRIAVDAGDGQPVELDLLAVRMQSRDGLDDRATGDRGWALQADAHRARRAAQAAWLVAWSDAAEAADPTRPRLVLGGFDAFEDSDGHVDVIGALAGRQAPEAAVWLPVPATPAAPLQVLGLEVPPLQRYTDVRAGIAQALDHLLGNAAMSSRFVLATRHPHLPSVRPRRFDATAGAPAFAAARDPLVLDLALPAASQADAHVRLLDVPATANPNRDNTYRWYVDNAGPDPAGLASLRIRTTLPTDAWQIYPDTAAWACGAATATAGGSERVCRHRAMAIQEANFFTMLVPANAELEGVLADTSLALSGGWTDAVIADNEAAFISQFSSAADLAVQVQPSATVIPGNPAGFNLTVRNLTSNDPGATTLVADIDAPLASVTPYTLSVGTHCAGTDLGGGRSRWTCSRAAPQQTPDVIHVLLQAATSLGDGGRRIGLQAGATSTGLDRYPDNNAADGEVVLSDQSDLYVYAPEDFGTEWPLDGEAVLPFELASRAPGVARGATLRLEVDAPADRVVGVLIQRNRGAIMEWSCGAAQALSPARSAIDCTSSAPLLADDVQPVTWRFGVRVRPTLVPDLARVDLGGEARVATTSTDLTPADNQVSNTTTVDQTADIAIQDATTPGALTFEPRPSRHEYYLQDLGRNASRGRRVVVEVEDVVDPASIVAMVVPSPDPLPCTPIAAPAGRTAVDCALPGGALGDSTFLRVEIPTRPSLYGSTRIVHARVRNQLVDEVPGNDAALGRVAVDADADLCLFYGGCGGQGAPFPKVAAGGTAVLPLHLANLGPSTAVDARLGIVAGLAPGRASIAGGDPNCDAAVAEGAGSRITCRFGDLPGDRTLRRVDLRLDATGLAAGATIPLQYTAGSTRPDRYPGNDAAGIVVQVVPAVDLRARLVPKTVDEGLYGALVVHAEGGVAGGETIDIPSMLDIEFEQPLAMAAPTVESRGWRCGAPGLAGGLGRMTCIRDNILPAGGSEGVWLRFEAHAFEDVGRTVRVRMRHAFFDTHLVADPTPDDGRVEQAFVLGGRATLSAAPPVQVPLRRGAPAAGPRTGGPRAARHR